MLQMKWWLAGKRKGKTCKFVVKLRTSAVSDCWISLCWRRKAIKVLLPMFVTFILQIFHRKRGAYHSENSGFWFELHPAVWIMFLRFSHKMHRMYTTHVSCKHSGERCVKKPHTSYGFRLASSSALSVCFAYFSLRLWRFSPGTLVYFLPTYHKHARLKCLKGLSVSEWCTSNWPATYMGYYEWIIMFGLFRENANI